jgi:hypothetical protein
LAFVSPKQAAGDPITFAFHGAVIDEPTGAFAILAGGMFSLVFTFESDTPDANPGDPLSGIYFGAILGGYLAVRTSTDYFRWDIDPFVPLTNEITVFPATGFYAVGPGLTGPSIGGITPTYLLAQFWDDDGLVFSSDALPTSLSLGTFERTNLQLTFPGSAPFCCASLGEISKVQAPVRPVPEPSTLFLVAIGTGVAGRHRRRAENRRIISC